MSSSKRKKLAMTRRTRVSEAQTAQLRRLQRHGEVVHLNRTARAIGGLLPEYD